jgi:hypothetical protein
MYVLEQIDYFIIYDVISIYVVQKDTVFTVRVNS